MKHILTTLLLASALTAHAQTITFESASDLTGYMTIITSNATLTQGASFGANSTGGLCFQGNSGASDRGSISYKPMSGDATTFATYQASMLVNVREANDTSADKGELRMGFTTNNAVDTSKPWEFFHKSNPSISLVFKGEHKPAESKTSLLSVEMSSLATAGGAETKAGLLTLNPGTGYFEDWLKVTLTITRTGPTTFAASYALDSVGLDGSSPPVNIFSSSVATFTNAAFGSATSIFQGFACKTEKSKITSMYLDDHSASATAGAPPAPAATAATSVNSSGLAANWLPGTGVAATDYVLELTTQADNFAPNTFINASGTGGQSSGIAIADGATLSQTITGLSPLVSYVYRVIAINSVGASAPSNVITATTPNSNAPPFVNVIADVGPIAAYSPPQTISISGISAGGEPGQTVSITAASSNTAVIPHPTVSYSAPDTTGALTFDPTGVEGSATITVTLDDGQSENATFTRTFLVTVSNPPVMVGFDSAADLSLFNIAATNITNTFSADGGVTGEGGIISQIAAAGSDSSALFLRSQTYPLPGVTQFTTSLMVNLREFDDIASGERKGDIRLGFSPTNSVNTSKPDEFFHKTNHGISVLLKCEHSTTDTTKNRKLECELTSQDGLENKAGKITLTGQTTAVNDWLKLTLSITPAGGNQLICSYTLHDMGADGADAPSALMTSGSYTFTNTTFGAAANLFAGFTVKPDKVNTSAIFVDEHTVSVSTDPPAPPVATAASQITSGSFNANWTPGAGAYATGWIVEVVRGSDAFTAGNFLSATGAAGQSSGIAVSANAVRTLRTSGLLASTEHRYRIRAVNLNGTSAASGIITLMTLPLGENAPPTLDAIADPAPIAMNAGAQTVGLTGISDGGELTQTISIIATSSNTTLIPHPTVNYFSPDATGTLEFTPNAGAVGSSTITVTVNDGGANNASFSRSFTVNVVAPNPTIEFDDPLDMNLVGFTHVAGTSAVHQSAAGMNASGAVLQEGATAGVERVSVGIRPTAYDANSAGYLVSSMMVNFSQVLNAPSNSKDKAELRLGFMANNTPNSGNLKETMNKTAGNASLGVIFKAEHQPATADKFQKLEAELFMGPSDTKAGKQTLLGQGIAMSHWLKVNFYAVRGGLSSFFLTYIIEDWGADGTTFLGQIMGSGPHVFTSSAFGADTSVFAAFTLNGDAAGSGLSQFFLDRYFADVNTTAPHAPIAQEESDLEHTTFTANWSAAALGPEPDGFVVEVCKASDNFAPGTLISATGALNQTQGIVVNDGYASSLAITGLTRQTTYLFRVRAFKGAEQGAMLNIITVVTPYGPGLEYADWRALVFGANAGDDAVAGAQADPDGDGVANLLEWGFNLNALLSDAHLLPQPTISGPYLRLTFQRRHNVTGFSFIPEITSTLRADDWHPEQIVYVSVSEPDANGMETVIVEDELPMAASPRRFMRVCIE